MTDHCIASVQAAREINFNKLQKVFHVNCGNVSSKSPLKLILSGLICADSALLLVKPPVNQSLCEGSIGSKKAAVNRN